MEDILKSILLRDDMTAEEMREAVGYDEANMPLTCLKCGHKHLVTVHIEKLRMQKTLELKCAECKEVL
jgi:transcription elongation factor Elf1